MGAAARGASWRPCSPSCPSLGRLCAPPHTLFARKSNALWLQDPAVTQHQIKSVLGTVFDPGMGQGRPLVPGGLISNLCPVHNTQQLITHSIL